MEKRWANSLVRYRVPMSWALGLLALAIARPTPELLTIGVVVGAMGQVLRLWAAGHLVKGQGITRSGPYASTRNPLYFGSSAIGLGFVIASGRWELFSVLAILVLGVFVPVMKTEARSLEQRFPQIYSEYGKAVPMFFPRLWPRTEWFNERRFSWKLVRKNHENVTVVGWFGAVVLLWVKMLLIA